MSPTEYPRMAMYLAYNDDEELLYVGISSNWGRRWAQHSLQPYFLEVSRLEIQWFDTKAEALRQEALTIKAFRPKYNSTHNERAIHEQPVG